MTILSTWTHAQSAVDVDWLDILPPASAPRTAQDDLNDALAGLRTALLQGGSGYVVIDPDQIDPADDLDRELAQLAAIHWND